MARVHMSEIVQGKDPLVDRQQARKSITVAELCDLSIPDANGRVKTSTLSMDRSRIERHVKHAGARW
jgi:hypothetical protein